MSLLEPVGSVWRGDSEVVLQYPAVVNTDVLLGTHTRIGCSDEWRALIGQKVEVWLRGVLYRKGIIDDALPGSKGLWLAQDGVFQREFIDVISGYEVWLLRTPSIKRDPWGSMSSRSRR